MTGAEPGFQTLKKRGDTDHHDFDGYETAQLITCKTNFTSDKNNVYRQHQDDKHVLGACHQCRQHVGFFVGNKEHITWLFAGDVVKRWKQAV